MGWKVPQVASKRRRHLSPSALGCENRECPGVEVSQPVPLRGLEGFKFEGEGLTVLGEVDVD